MASSCLTRHTRAGAFPDLTVPGGWAERPDFQIRIRKSGLEACDLGVKAGHAERVVLGEDALHPSLVDAADDARRLLLVPDALGER